jgi:DNA modification methylase
VESGQLWQLGEHRILCGDSTKPDDVKKSLDGAEPFLMVTDPPYGVNYDASWRADSINQGNVGDMATGKVVNDDIADWTVTWELFGENGGGVAYVWHAGSHSPTVADSLYSSGFELRNLIIWAKDRLAISRGNYHHQHEPCWYVVKKGTNAKFTEDRTQSTLFRNIQDVVRPGELVFLAKDEAKKVYAIRGDRSVLWQIPKPTKSETGHSTQKPVECMARPIRNHDSEFVYEPFSGSGTTIIACEQLNRKCRAIEISPAYVAVAIQRWADATGKEPKKLSQ